MLTIVYIILIQYMSYMYNYYYSLSYHIFIGETADCKESMLPQLIKRLMPCLPCLTSEEKGESTALSKNGAVYH